jgi:hypothetical protein
VMAAAAPRKKCEHGFDIGAQGGIVQQEIDACDGDENLLVGLLQFYSACDCCDTLMHHSTCGNGYQVLADGRTLCGGRDGTGGCYRGEPL